MWDQDSAHRSHNNAVARNSAQQTPAQDWGPAWLPKTGVTAQSPCAPLAPSPAPRSVMWPPRDPRLADWSLSRRERWGRRANALENQGASLWQAEEQAFQEVLNEPGDHRRD